MKNHIIQIITSVSFLVTMHVGLVTASAQNHYDFADQYQALFNFFEGGPNAQRRTGWGTYVQHPQNGTGGRSGLLRSFDSTVSLFHNRPLQFWNEGVKSTIQISASFYYPPPTTFEPVDIFRIGLATDVNDGLQFWLGSAGVAASVLIHEGKLALGFTVANQQGPYPGLVPPSSTTELSELAEGWYNLYLGMTPTVEHFGEWRASINLTALGPNGDQEAQLVGSLETKGLTYRMQPEQNLYAGIVARGRSDAPALVDDFFVVPEPNILALVGIGLAGLVMNRRRSGSGR